jgi:hypothetical protein
LQNSLPKIRPQYQKKYADIVLKSLSNVLPLCAFIEIPVPRPACATIGTVAKSAESVPNGVARGIVEIIRPLPAIDWNARPMYATAAAYVVAART